MNRRVLIGCHTSMRLPVHSWSVRNKMAEAKRVFSEDEFSSALAKALTNFKYSSLKEEQIECVRRIICFREDVLAVLPTGFGKSVIFQIIPIIKQHLKLATYLHKRHRFAGAGRYRKTHHVCHNIFKSFMLSPSSVQLK